MKKMNFANSKIAKSTTFLESIVRDEQTQISSFQPRKNPPKQGVKNFFTIFLAYIRKKL